MKHYFHGKKQVAWEACRSLYIGRIANGVPGVPECPVTDFPAEEIAKEAPLPVSTDELSHIAAFDGLRERFEQRWEE